MNDSIFLTAFKWMGNHKPDVMIFLIILFSAIWLNTQFNDFGRRIDKVEYRLDKIEEGIAEICSDVKVMKEEMSEIKAFMIKIDTYLSTTNKDYPKR